MSDRDVVIRVEGVSKLYRLGEVGTGSLAHDFNRWWHKLRMTKFQLTSLAC
jgi:lipopolysaccharide transport system ATP-binding protein